MASLRNAKGERPAGATEGPNTDTVTDRPTVPLCDSRAKSRQAPESIFSETENSRSRIVIQTEILSVAYCLAQNTLGQQPLFTHSVLAEETTGGT